MSQLDEITDAIDKIISTQWDERDGNVVPESEAVALDDGAVKIEAAFLYADLAGSSTLARLCPWQTTAKLIRAYLDCCTRLIRSHGGKIRSFDGDRVMGIFKSTRKINDAVECARQIDWAVQTIIRPKSKEGFKSIRDNNIVIKHCVGVDAGKAIAVRAGIRNNNDLIWIGRAPSFAAKLSDRREYPYEVYITKDCYDKLLDSNKSPDGENIWHYEVVDYAGEEHTVYCTKIPMPI